MEPKDKLAKAVLSTKVVTLIKNHATTATIVVAITMVLAINIKIKINNLKTTIKTNRETTKNKWLFTTQTTIPAWPLE
jgi:hypothetical protein